MPDIKGCDFLLRAFHKSVNPKGWKCPPNLMIYPYTTHFLPITFFLKLPHFCLAEIYFKENQSIFKSRNGELLFPSVIYIEGW